MFARTFLARTWPLWRRRLAISARRARLVWLIEIVAIFAFVVATLTTGVALSSHSNKAELLPSSLTATLLVGMLLPSMALLVLLGRRMALRRAAESIGGTGRLHVQLVFLFSMIAAIPTLLVVIFASFLFQSGVEFWFSDNSRGLLENANKLARGYYEQSQNDVSNETTAMAFDVRNSLSQTTVLSFAFQQNLSYQMLQRKLDEAAIVRQGSDGKLRTVVIADPARAVRDDRVTAAELRRLHNGEPIIVNANADSIEAIAPIDLAGGIFLYTARKSDLLALSQGRRAENIVRAYQVLTQRARLLQLRFNVALFVASLALVGLAVWFALRFADRQVQPLYQLVAAARRVGAGNYAIRIEGRTGADEIGLLNRAFNRMTAQIERQTRALVGANQQLEERRAFIEVVLESVTAGIISLDPAGGIVLMNSSAQNLLLDAAGGPAASPIGRPMAEIAPQIAALVEGGRQEGVVQHSRHGELLTLAVRLTRNSAGHVITFEDITRQLLDQRQAAWSDVARRIAHEIKNPLTPIQLATERLKRRYRKQIITDGDLFEELTATIIRQVGDLRKMVDEFSSFARLPKPVFRGEDAVDLARQAMFLQEVAHPEITFDFDAPGDIYIACDRHQFGQAMTNVLKNATEAIETQSKSWDPDYRGRITVQMRQEGEQLSVTIADNGIGLPQDRDRIIEPYVTTRDKGTGLGLAIVKKIVEEHGGDIVFASAEGGGTQVTMRFARDPRAAHRTSEAAE